MRGFIETTTLLLLGVSVALGFLSFSLWKNEEAALFAGPTVVQGPQGGTGTSTASAGDIGKLLAIASVNPLRYTFATDATGGGSGGGTWSTTTSQVSGTLINYPNNATDVVNIGSNATTTGEFWFDPNTNTARFTGSATTTLQFVPGGINPAYRLGLSFIESTPSISILYDGSGTGDNNKLTIWDDSTSLERFTFTRGGRLGIGTTSPYAKLSVAGDLVAGTITATTSTSTLAGLILNSGGLRVSTIVSCSEALETDGSGNVVCGTDATAAGAANDFSFATTYNTLSAATSSALWSQTRLFASSTVGAPNQLDFFNARAGTTTDATSTSLNVSGQLDFDGLTSALILTGAGGILAEYAGTSCTNQAVTALSVLGVATCTTLTPAYLDMTTAWDFGGATSLEIPNGSNPTVDAIGEVALDTTANEFLIATSTAAGAPAVFKPYRTFAFSYASSTQGSGTTTRSLGPVDAAGYFTTIQCDFNNFMRVMLYDGTNRLPDLVASSTIGTVDISTANNSFTAGEALRVDIGTTTNINGNVFGGCRAKFFYTRN